MLKPSEVLKKRWDNFLSLLKEIEKSEVALPIHAVRLSMALKDLVGIYINESHKAGSLPGDCGQIRELLFHLGPFVKFE